LYAQEEFKAQVKSSSTSMMYRLLVRNTPIGRSIDDV
jgi:hypothetical protein